MRKGYAKAYELGSAVVGAGLWVINAGRPVTGLRQMAFMDAVCAGMIFFFVPLQVWGSVRKYQ